MNYVLDLISATIIAGLVALVLLNLNTTASSTKFASDSALRLQENAETIAEILENDLRKVGYKYSGTAITTADTNKLTFYADIDSNGTTDQVTLTTSDSSAVSYTPNPNDKILYRIVDGDTSKGPSLGLTRLKFTYMNYLGNVTSVLDSIKYIKAEIWLQTPEKVDTIYAPTYWQITINPRNI